MKTFIISPAIYWLGLVTYFVDTTNNRVGITTADPDAGLHVNSNAYVHTDFRVGSGIAMNVTSGRITAGSFDGDGSLLSGVNSDSGSWVNGTNSNVHLATSTNKVGIGTVSPATYLHLSAKNSDPGATEDDDVGSHNLVEYLRFTSTSDSGDINAISAGFKLGEGDTTSSPVGRLDICANSFADGDNLYGSTPDVTVATFLGSGNVGIGTSSPSSILDIKEDSTAVNLTLRGGGPTVNDADVTLRLLETDTQFYGGAIRYAGASTPQGLRFGHFVNSSTARIDMSIDRGTGNVGIGTSSPDHKLEVSGTFRASGYVSTPYLYRSSHNSGYMVGSYNSVGANSQKVNPIYTIGSNYMPNGDDSIGNMYGIGYSHSNFTHLLSGGWGLYVAADGDVRIGLCGTNGRITAGGAMYVGTLGLDAGATGNQRKNLFIQSTYGGGQYGGGTSQSYGWWIGAQNQGLSSNDNDLYFGVVRNGAVKVCGVVLDQNTNVQMNFTGQHRTFVKDTPTNQLVDKEGLIVSADQNEFVKMSGGVVCGNEAITINESLPLVSLSTKANDKKCFGVLSTTEDPETRKEVYGNFASSMEKEEGDTRVYVNSVGEGAVWVTNINGILESGDYITTSNVAGYGMKQNDDILHNYTVAKILMDCDFNAVTQPKRIIKKEPKMVDYWIIYGDVKITEEEYHTLPDSRRKIVEDVHHRIDQMEVVKEDPEKDGFVYEQREDTVNVLDEHGQFQWEDSGETEKAYKVRYLLPDGTQISEEEYTTRASMDEKVYIAAFVGCTYHCG